MSRSRVAQVVVRVLQPDLAQHVEWAYADVPLEGQLYTRPLTRPPGQLTYRHEAGPEAPNPTLPADYGRLYERRSGPIAAAGDAQNEPLLRELRSLGEAPETKPNSGYRMSGSEQRRLQEVTGIGMALRRARVGMRG